VLVTLSALISLIDTDLFQVQEAHRRTGCDSSSSGRRNEYTLLGCTVWRLVASNGSPSTMCFALGVLYSRFLMKAATLSRPVAGQR
jgi:hypothetical protein